MPALTESHIKVLSPLIRPFERSKKAEANKVIRSGEGHNDEFLDKIHDGINNSKPNPYYEISEEELNKYRILDGGSWRDKCYLWVIDKVSIKIIWEGTLNVLRGEELPDRKCVCHTNITGCEPAYLGGELYFCENGNIYVNFKSDRYGWPDTDEKKHIAIDYMQYVGYRNLILTDI